METTNKKVWIRGNAEHPEKVIEALEKRGGKIMGNSAIITEAIYYIYPETHCICCTNETRLLAQLITTHPDWTEIFPEPEYKFKVGDKVRWTGNSIHEITAQKNFRGKPGYKLDYVSEVSEDALTLYEEPQIKMWGDFEKVNRFISGFAISSGTPKPVTYSPNNGLSKSVAISEKVAKAMLAMAKISQLMPYYGGEITDEEWQDDEVEKFVICRIRNGFRRDSSRSCYEFLAFHTEELREDFFNNNRQLVYDYLMFEWPLS